MNKKEMTQETKDKIRKAHIGMKYSEESRKKMSESAKKYVNDEFRIKMGLMTKNRYANMSLEERCRKNIKKSNNTSVRYWTSRIRGRLQFKLWQAAILKRDNYKCQICFKNSNLVTHHIYPMYKIIKENLLLLQDANFNIPILWDISNGVTRCKECHSKIDHHRGTNKNILRTLLNILLQEPIREELKIRIRAYLEKSHKGIKH